MKRIKRTRSLFLFEPECCNFLLESEKHQQLLLSNFQNQNCPKKYKDWSYYPLMTKVSLGFLKLKPSENERLWELINLTSIEMLYEVYFSKKAEYFDRRTFMIWFTTLHKVQNSNQWNKTNNRIIYCLKLVVLCN